MTKENIKGVICKMSVCCHGVTAVFERSSDGKRQIMEVNPEFAMEWVNGALHHNVRLPEVLYDPQVYAVSNGRYIECEVGDEAKYN